MPKPSVLLTSAGGYIAQQLIPVFRERYNLKLVDLTNEHDGRAVDGIEVADLLLDDLGALTPLFSGVDVVVHTGYHRSTETDTQSRYEGERLNIDMMQRVFQLALEQVKVHQERAVRATLS